MAITSTVADSLIQLAGEWRTGVWKRLTKLEELARGHEAMTAAAARRGRALNELDHCVQGAVRDRGMIQVPAEYRVVLIRALSGELAEVRGGIFRPAAWGGVRRRRSWTRPLPNAKLGNRGWPSSRPSAHRTGCRAAGSKSNWLLRSELGLVTGVRDRYRILIEEQTVSERVLRHETLAR
jgi:hypothetical protein